MNEGFTRLRRMIGRLIDDGKKAGLVVPEADTSRVTEIVFSGLLGACVMYNLDHSRSRLNATIQSLIQSLNDIRRDGKQVPPRR